MKLANAMMKAGNFGPASRVLAQRLKGSPADGEALYLYGTALYRSGKDARAEAAFRRLVSLAPNDARAHYSLGMALARLNRVDEAGHSLSRAVQLDPRHQRARQALTRLSQGSTSVSGKPAGSQPSTPPLEDADHLTPGHLLGRGHRRVSSYAGRFLAAALVGAAGFGLLVTYQPGRLRWFAERPPFQLPSLDFLRDRFETTGQEAHRRELEDALTNVVSRSDLFDTILIGIAVALVVLAAALVVHAILAAAHTEYEVYERRIDVKRGVLDRRRMSAWLYEIVDVELRQTPMLTLSDNAEVRIHLPQTGYAKPSRFNDRTKLRIIGFGSTSDQERLYREIRDAALKERRIMRRWYL
ncbi:MAG: tetratricopeptide repeat protein [Acidimicrobiales bacterium]